MKRINGSLLMGHEYSACALVELLEIAKTAPGADGVLHHAPEAFPLPTWMQSFTPHHSVKGPAPAPGPRAGCAPAPCLPRPRAAHRGAARAPGGRARQIPPDLVVKFQAVDIVEVI
jgi:hypothetical protein